MKIHVYNNLTFYAGMVGLLCGMALLAAASAAFKIDFGNEPITTLVVGFPAAYYIAYKICKQAGIPI